MPHSQKRTRIALDNTLKSPLLDVDTSTAKKALVNIIGGEESAIESKEDIRHLLGDAQLVFITCGLGGGTGTGSIPIIAHEAKEAGALTVAIATLPFGSEGKIRMRNALEGLARLKRATDTTIIIPFLALSPSLLFPL